MSVYDVVTERIIEYIEKNAVLPWTKPWATVNTVNQNFKSRAPYSGINILLTGMSGFSSPYWLTFKQAKELGGTVKKGEKATPVIFWSTFEKKEDAEDDVDKPKARGFHRMYFVFNAEQIEGIDFPSLGSPRSIEFNPLEEAENIVANMPKCPSVKHRGQKAFYAPALDAVTVPKPEHFESAEHYYSTLFHELAHSTGHPSRLNRFAIEGTNHRFGSKSYSKEELVAEMSSAFILNSIGINTENSDRNSAAYIKSWLTALMNDPKLVVTAASKAAKAADYIMNKEVKHV